MHERGEILKAGMFIACAFGFGMIGTMPEIDSEWLLVLPVLLGIIFFVLKALDWPPQLAPLMCACIAGGRVTGHWWSNSKGMHISPLMDGEGWFWLGLSAVCFAVGWWRSVHGQPSSDLNSK